MCLAVGPVSHTADNNYVITGSKDHYIKVRRKGEEVVCKGEDKEENGKDEGKGRMKGQGMGKVGRQNWSEEKLLTFLM